MSSVVKYNSDIQDVQRIPCWHVFDVTGSILNGANEDIALMVLPANTIILDWKAQCILAPGGGTSSRFNLQVDNDGTPVVLTAGTADNAGVVGIMDPIELGPLGFGALVDDGSVYTLETNHVAVGNEVSAPAMRISVNMFRSHRP